MIRAIFNLIRFTLTAFLAMVTAFVILTMVGMDFNSKALLATMAAAAASIFFSKGSKAKRRR